MENHHNFSKQSLHTQYFKLRFAILTVLVFKGFLRYLWTG